MNRLVVLVAGVGIAQIVSWGSLYYAIGVLGKPMREDLGVSELFVFSAFTAGLLVSGTLAPLTGRCIDRFGGRVVLACGSVVAAIALATIAMAPNAGTMVAGWLLAGAAMSASLYDPAFATLSQHTGPSYRRAVTALTLLGGFASTVFWPLSQWLLDAHGWRWTLGCYAVLQLALCLPIHLLVIPHGSPHARARDPAASVVRSAGFSDPRLRFLSAAFAMTSFVTGVVGVHMVGLLSGAGLTTKEAVAISMLMGPMQVAGRIVELVFARRVRTVTVGVIAFLLISSAVGILIVSHAWMWAVVFVAAYGFGNGVMTIVKGTTPAELYGREGLGELLGYLSRANAYATALGPAAWTALALGLGRSGGLVAVAAIGLGGLAAFKIATRSRTTAVAAERT